MFVGKYGDNDTALFLNRHRVVFKNLTYARDL